MRPLRARPVDTWWIISELAVDYGGNLYRMAPANCTRPDRESVPNGAGNPYLIARNLYPMTGNLYLLGGAKL